MGLQTNEVFSVRITFWPYFSCQYTFKSRLLKVLELFQDVAKFELQYMDL